LWFGEDCVRRGGEISLATLAVDDVGDGDLRLEIAGVFENIGSSMLGILSFGSNLTTVCSPKAY
jgi:hypothetical protein